VRVCVWLFSLVRNKQLDAPQPTLSYHHHHYQAAHKEQVSSLSARLQAAEESLEALSAQLAAAEVRVLLQPFAMLFAAIDASPLLHSCSSTLLSPQVQLPTSHTPHPTHHTPHPTHHTLPPHPTPPHHRAAPPRLQPPPAQRVRAWALTWPQLDQKRRLLGGRRRG